MKKQIVSIALSVLVIAISGSTNASVLNNSKSPHFEVAKNNNLNTGGDLVIYSQKDGHNVTTAFDKKGKWVYTIKHFSSDNLAKDAMDIIVRNFGYYYITGMEEIKQPGFETVIMVHAQDQKSLKTFRIVNGDAELVQELVKS